VHVRSAAPDGAPFDAESAFVDVDPTRTIVPARPASGRPPEALRRGGGADDRVRRLLAGAAATALLLDLLLLAAALGGSRKLASRPALP
jgi:hypothetical protein